MNVNESSLLATAEIGKKYLQVGYIDHLEWLKQKGVSTHFSSQSFQISPQRLEKLSSLLEKELLKLNQGSNDLFARKRYLHTPSKDFFTESPEVAAKELSILMSPLVINNIKAQIEKNQNDWTNRLSGPNMTESELVSLRSPIIDRSELHKGVVGFLNQKTEISEDNLHEREDIAEQLATLSLKNL